MIWDLLKYHQQSKVLLICFLLIFCATSTVTAYAPERVLHYGHRAPRLPPSALRAPLKEPYKYKYIEMPTCDQLREVWKISVRELSDYMDDGFSNEIPKLADNPYYLSYLTYLTQQHKSRNTIGKPFSFSKPLDTTEDNFEGPSWDNGVFGKVIYSPNERKHPPNAQTHGSPSSHRISTVDSPAIFGPIVSESREERKSEKTSQNDAGHGKSVGRTSEGGAHLSAGEFFGGSWHDEPIVPSV